MGWLRSTIFWIIECMSGAHPVVAGVASVYVIGDLGGESISPIGKTISESGGT
jgi:hypothetical protein